MSSEDKRISILEREVSKNGDRILSLEAHAIRNETNILAIQGNFKDFKSEQQMCTEDTKELIEQVREDLRKEIVASEVRTKDDIRRIETQIRIELGDTRKEIVKIIENDLAHVKFDVDSHIHNNDKLDLLKLIGGIVGGLSGIYIIIQNSTAILQWVFDVLNIFF